MIDNYALFFDLLVYSSTDETLLCILLNPTLLSKDKYQQKVVSTVCEKLISAFVHF